MNQYVLTSAVVLTSPVFAGFDQILDGIRMLARKRSEETGERVFQGQIATFFENIDHYGCWCNFGKDYHNGRGPVQDSIDSDCKVMVSAQRCAKWDSIQRGNECNPATIEYIPFNLFSSNVDILDECIEQNLKHPENPECAADACVIEGDFTLKYFGAFFSGLTFDVELQHDYHAGGTFDQSVSCITGHDGAIGPKSCCGELPTRFPFDTQLGARQCCYNATFSADTHECCDSEKIQQIGTC